MASDTIAPPASTTPPSPTRRRRSGRHQRGVTATFWLVVKQSCIFAVTAVAFKAAIGFFVAHFLDIIPATGRRKWHAILLVPWVIPPAMSCLTWLWLFDPSFSAFNWALARFGVGPVPWTGTDYWARFSVILVNIGSARRFL